MPQASGPFEVTITPDGEQVRAGAVITARMLLEKSYSGDFCGTGRGTMLSALSDTAGSGAYVAIEHVEGVLHGRQGSFVLHHDGAMCDGNDQLSVRIVPNSGSGALAGISGALRISMVEGRHWYALDYVLAQ